MKKLIFAFVAIASFGGVFGSAAQAQYLERRVRDNVDREVIVERSGRRDVDREVIVERAPRRNLNDGYDRYYNRRRAKTVYIIENGRPVRRVVYTDGRGRYYRGLRGDDSYQQRVFESYPTRYYDRGGRARPGISINF